MELPIETMLEEMFKENKYRTVDNGDLQKMILGKKVSISGYLSDYLFGETLEIDFGYEGGNLITLVYSPRLGISEEELSGICGKLKENNLKTKIYGEIAEDKDNENYKVVQLHKIEFCDGGVKQEFPNAKQIYDIQEKFPKIDDFIQFQKYEKQAAKTLANSDDDYGRKTALKAKAELEFYKSFSDFKDNLCKSLKEKAEELIVIESNVPEKGLEQRL